ncbi:unnamed protein product [Clavelina lepadiformis]|uniref:Uncharacterized protein n=1 Tax=Clavelina lepadiformis TaxID=159417 RepID=A0ABP0GB13_CLALP
MNGSILTNEEFNEQVENFEANGTIAKKRKAGRRRRNADEDEEINSLDLEEEEIERMEREIQRQMDEDMRRVDTEDEMVEESDDESEEMNDKTREDTVVRMEDVEEERRDVTEESVNEQKKEKRTFKLEINKKQVVKYFAVFWEKPKTYYWGKLLKVFRDEVDGKIEQVEFKFWDKKSTSEDAVYWDWQTKEDIDTVTVENCFWGPSTAVLTSVGRAKSYFGFAEEEEHSDMRPLTIMTEESELFDLILGEIGMQVDAFNVIPAMAIIAFYPPRVTQRILQGYENIFAYWPPHRSWTDVEKVIKKET